MNEIMNDNEFIERAKIETGIEPYFIKENTKYTINDEVFFPKNSYLIKEEMPKWTLLDETKTINGMVCYKAISNYSTRPNNSFPIVAWYCPSLSSNFGPYGIGGLPGTILILQYGYKVFTATSIKHNVSKLIEFPNNIEIITMEKFAKVKEVVAAIEADVEKFYNAGNSAAGTRVRKAMQDLKGLAQEIRTEVTEKKNSAK